MKERKVSINGVDTTLLLNDEDAKNYDAQGFSRKRAEGQDAPATKARKSPENK